VRKKKSGKYIENIDCIGVFAGKMKSQKVV
jgi:hypothetical protein